MSGKYAAVSAARVAAPAVDSVLVRLAREQRASEIHVHDSTRSWLSSGARLAVKGECPRTTADHSVVHGNLRRDLGIGREPMAGAR